MPRDRTLAPEKGSRLPTAWMSFPVLKTATCSPPTSAHTPVNGTMSSRRQTLYDFGVALGRLAGSNLSTFVDEHHAGIGGVAVDEMAEAPEDLRRFDRLLP